MITKRFHSTHLLEYRRIDMETFSSAVTNGRPRMVRSKNGAKVPRGPTSSCTIQSVAKPRNVSLQISIRYVVALSNRTPNLDAVASDRNGGKGGQTESLNAKTNLVRRFACCVCAGRLGGWRFMSHGLTPPSGNSQLRSS